MENVVDLAVVQGGEQLLHDCLDGWQGKPHLLVTQESSKVVLTELKHQINAALLTVVGRSWREGEREGMCVCVRARVHVCACARARARVCVCVCVWLLLPGNITRPHPLKPQAALSIRETGCSATGQGKWAESHVWCGRSQ